MLRKQVRSGEFLATVIPYMFTTCTSFRELKCTNRKPRSFGENKSSSA
jgi:hypothetical protein